MMNQRIMSWSQRCHIMRWLLKDPLGKCVVNQLRGETKREPPLSNRLVRYMMFPAMDGRVSKSSFQQAEEP